MEEHGLSEHDAFRMIQRTAMERRVSMRDVAEKVLDGDLKGRQPS
jgi:response regulator NasT